MYFIRYLSPVGPLTVAGDGLRLTGLWLDGQNYFQSTLREPLLPDPGCPVLAQARAWLDRYFAGEKTSPEELPLAPSGSAFRQLIWKELCRIPYGEVTTYGSLAERAALLMNRNTMSAQAVGGAVGHNPISIIIPCHRVVGAGGSLTGYAGGIHNKIALLKLEGVDMSRFHVPAFSPAP